MILFCFVCLVSLDPIPSDTFVMVTNYTESTITISWLNHQTADSVLLFISETRSGFEKFYPVFPALSSCLPTYEFSDLKSFTSYKIILVINGENAVYKTITQKTRKYEHGWYKGYCTPDQICDCLCIFLKNDNTLVTDKICFLKVTFQGTLLLHWNFTNSSGY